MSAVPLVVAPTWLEYFAARSVMPGGRIIHSGMGRATVGSASDPVVICGLAGGLRRSLAAGSVVVADSVARESDSVMACDPALVDAMVEGGRRVNVDVARVRLLTASGLVVGAERSRWADKGFDVADMETGYWAAAGRRTTSVRVILDTPSRSFSPEWMRPGRALLTPRLWGEMAWMASHAPMYARRAAMVVRAGLEVLAE